MRLIRYSRGGAAARTGLVCAVHESCLVELPAPTATAAPADDSGPELLRALARLAPGGDLAVTPRDGEHLPWATVELRPVVERPGKVLAVGCNFVSHRDEALRAGEQLPEPTRPYLFAKMPSTVAADGQDVFVPRGGRCLDYEVELTVVIGSTCRAVAPEEALSHVAGYTVANDLTLREVLFTGQGLFEAKNFDGFLPLSSVLVPTASAGDPRDLRLRTRVNGDVRQSETMAGAYFSCAELVSYASHRMTLDPGDLILCGTPSGVAAFADDPASQYLNDSDRVVAEIEGVASVTSIVRTGGGLSVD
ncbi:fumarylacetoacetate hydrolase family protein [Nocardioides sp. L-11A]|uniref:fumarylacetoacetate hydrolase family protein n=1 Tax=Nocardioides sp. L-11A TaxID=3043848 RepID=UPI00249C3EC6|nr:fumarylacetoacetate hydrolase family protein [Nocardioides sp. L-11A]